MIAPLSRGMILTAGLGTRMRPITDTIPKPLVQVGDATMLDRVIAHLLRRDLSRLVINLHYLPEAITDHLHRHPLPPAVEVLYSDERAHLLETGGGVKHALPLLGDQPFWVANADIIWLDGPEHSAVDRLAAAWDPARMDALLLLHPTESAHGYEGSGDFFCSENGEITSRRGSADHAPYVYAGLQILNPTVFDDTPMGAWLLNVVFDRLLKQGRLFGVIHDGAWFHVGTPDRIAPTAALISQALSSQG